MYRYFFFDLDGTLTDSEEGITNGVKRALAHFGVEPGSREGLRRYIGPPLAESFRQYHGLTETQAAEAVKVYREYYFVTGLFENRVYEGIPEMLAALKKAGRTIVLATSKPEVSAGRILEHFGLMPYFDFLSGATLDGSRSAKADVIAHALESLQIGERSQVLMAGDRRQDVLGAAACGVDCAGVLYGFGSREELSGAGAKYLVETPADILKLL